MISIITACSRPKMLPHVAESIQDFIKPFFDVQWYVIFDSKNLTAEDMNTDNLVSGLTFPVFVNHTPEGVWGCSQRNMALKMISDGESWVYALDDDNMMHRDFRLLEPYMKGKSILTFDQDCGGGTIIRKGDDPRLDHIDMAQVLIKRKIYEFFIQDYGADGEIIERLVSKHPGEWLYVEKIACYYNRVRGLGLDKI